MYCTRLEPGLEAGDTGAKAANLAKLMEHGFRVPDGFVLKRQGLGVFLEENGLIAEVEHYLKESPTRPHDQRVGEHEKLCARLSGAAMPEAVVESVEPALAALLREAPVGLAVRSSGAYEDSAQASFAGVYDSVLGVSTVESFWQAVLTCWGAAWSPAALDYAGRMGIEPEADAMGVLVQALVAADSAGVLFTADPQTGNPWHFVLESAFGLAQELVAGTGATPADRFVLEWDSGGILSKEVVAKKTRLVAGAGGVKAESLGAAERGAASLADDAAQHLARQALGIDRVFGCRVDIEWVHSGGELYIVQVRPLTALPEFFPLRLSPRQAQKTWRQPEYWPFYFSKPGAKVTPPMHRDQRLDEIQARCWPGPRHRQPRRLALDEADFNNHRYLAFAAQEPERPRESLEAYLERYEGQLRRDFLDAKKRQFPSILAEAERRLGLPRALPELIDAVLWVRDMRVDLTGFMTGPAQSLFGATHNLLQGFFDSYLPEYDLEPLVQGYHPDLEPYYPHAQMAEAKMLAAAVGDGPLRQAFGRMAPAELLVHLFEAHQDAPFMTVFTDYCRRFGLYMPDPRTSPGAGERHRDAVGLTQGVLKGEGVELDGLKTAAAKKRQTYAERLMGELERSAPQQLARFERLWDWHLFWGPALNDRGWGGVASQKVFELWMDVRVALEKTGLVKPFDELFYFTVDDLNYIAATGDIAEGRRILRRRRLEFERYERLAPPAWLGAEPVARGGTALPAAVDGPADGPRLLGRRCVTGRCRGRAFRIAALADADTAGAEHVVVLTQALQPNAAATPVLFSLLMRVAGLVIVDGPMMWTHHVSQVARECGVPIVQLGAADIDRIAEGATLELDGKAGAVTLA